ncbi:helix-turn-helix domain-containing protein [Rhizobium sp. LC145]|uniref:helix-turn-helix transcriptional regulator n=1 Tax=Rhizobium sp. LC145 TaxID=1120688 RepID=UPI00069975C8|nr:helix-turn-helix domain-containing protein [Rhizobium sp. LC145]
MTEKMTTDQAAAYICKSASWLHKSRMTGTGPVYLKIGGAVRYLVSDLDAWLAGTRRTGVYAHCNDNERARSVA